MFREVDVGDDGLAVGKVLRIKVVIDICKPLMRGIMVKVGSEEKDKWFPFAYEFCWISATLVAALALWISSVKSDWSKVKSSNSVRVCGTYQRGS